MLQSGIGNMRTSSSASSGGTSTRTDPNLRFEPVITIEKANSAGLSVLRKASNSAVAFSFSSFVESCLRTSLDHSSLQAAFLDVVSQSQAETFQNYSELLGFHTSSTSSKAWATRTTLKKLKRSMDWFPFASFCSDQVKGTLRPFERADRPGKSHDQAGIENTVHFCTWLCERRQTVQGSPPIS